ncbi:MAG: DNA double-strand break repair nuclease NurA [Polyangiaceae bacterium]|nr:DNA double-strand break repair nuclease NurA [Polyangiaceae bacterium]
MRFDLHLRRDVSDQIRSVAEQMGAWEHQPRLSEDDQDRLRAAIHGFSHTTSLSGVRFAGVDGSGDFPSLTYADSFVYLSVAAGAVYETDPLAGLREVDAGTSATAQFTWLPGDNDEAVRQWDLAFEALARRPLAEVIHGSDYRTLKAGAVGRPQREAALALALLRPKASDAGNVAIQLRSCAELGAALALVRAESRPDIVLVDGTLSLPMVTRDEVSLFHEHLKRLVAVEARSFGSAFVTISKSHGLPGIEEVERLAAEVLGSNRPDAEHWYLRLPRPGEGWECPLTAGRQVPPCGAVSYLVRFHYKTPVLRVDVDEQYWRGHLAGGGEERLFERLDYAGHDQRCYGYPYPIKAGHDRASLTEKERVALRKQLIDAAVASGMSRRLFRSPSFATGHG